MNDKEKRMSKKFVAKKQFLIINKGKMSIKNLVLKKYIKPTWSVLYYNDHCISEGFQQIKWYEYLLYPIYWLFGKIKTLDEHIIGCSGSPYDIRFPVKFKKGQNPFNKIKQGGRDE